MKYLSFTFLLLLSLMGTAWAAADIEPVKSDSAWLAEAKASIKSEKYDQAAKQLQAANETSSADWNNLLGYTYVKNSPLTYLGPKNIIKLL